MVHVDNKPPLPQVQSFPPPQHNEPQPFPPLQDYLKPPPMTALPFPPPPPPPQQQTAPQPYPPNVYINIQNTAQQQQNQQMIPMGLVVLPSIPMPQPWMTDLFGCMNDPQNAIITLLCPCVTFGQIAEVLDNGGTSCATSGMLYTCVAFWIGMPCLMSCGYRSKLRAKFDLIESPASDCLIHCLCEYCALCQEYRELNERGFDPSIGHAGNVANQQRQQQFGMAPPVNQTMMC